MAKKAKVYYALHRFTETTEVIVRIKASTMKEAQEINQNWNYGTPSKTVRVLSKDVYGGDYSASCVHEKNDLND